MSVPPLEEDQPGVFGRVNGLSFQLIHDPDLYLPGNHWFGGDLLKLRRTCRGLLNSQHTHGPDLEHDGFVCRNGTQAEHSSGMRNDDSAGVTVRPQVLVGPHR